VEPGWHGGTVPLNQEGDAALTKDATRKDIEMTTGLTTQQHATSVAAPSHDAPSFDGLVHMGDQLRRTGFLPSHIKDGVSFAAIVLMGRELGMGTMAACRKLQVIKGTVTERADSQLARFKSCGGRAQFKELTETRAVLVLRHPNGDEHTETFTLEDAKRAGLSSNDNYSKHPKAMLRSRAITAGLKSIGWEGAVGIYDPDEVADIPSTPEPVVVRPKFDTPPDPAPNPFDAAKLAIQRANNIELLDALRARVESRLRDKTFTSFQADELFDEIHAKVEFLEAESEVPA
jgi:hypothetical protein